MTNLTPAEADAAADRRVRRNQRRALAVLAAALLAAPTGTASAVFLATGETAKIVPVAGNALAVVICVALLIATAARLVPSLCAALGLPSTSDDERDTQVSNQAMASAFAVTMVALTIYAVLWRHPPTLWITIGGQALFLVLVILGHRRT